MTGRKLRIVMNTTEFRKLMKLQGGFNAKAKQGKSVFGWGNITTAYSTVMVIAYDEYYKIVCSIENEWGNVYYPFGETEIKINKADNALKSTFTVADEEGVFEDTTSNINNIIFSGYFPTESKEYVKKLCELIFAVNNER